MFVGLRALEATQARRVSTESRGAYFRGASAPLTRLSAVSRSIELCIALHSRYKGKATLVTIITRSNKLYSNDKKKTLIKNILSY